MRTWRGYIIVSLIATAFCLLIAFSAIVLLDPFGRLGLVKSSEIGFEDERPSMVSRALDAQFNSVIIGNSTSIPLMPAHLDQLTGQRFTSLSISGSDAPASIATLKFFLAHHANPRIALVALLPEIWCGPTFSEHRPFPFWLYSSLPHYFWGLAGDTSFELIRTTLSDRKKLRANGHHTYIGIDGYHSLIGPFEEPSYNDPSLVRARMDGGTRPETTDNPDNFFPSIGHLIATISQPSPVFYVLLWTPRYIAHVPASGSHAENTERVCKEMLTNATSSLSNVRILDWSRSEIPENNDPLNFFDIIHYRRPYAGRVEESILEALPITVRGR